MSNVPGTPAEIVKMALSEQLYEALVDQLNKDLLRANLEVAFPSDLPPELLTSRMSALIYDLITRKFADFLNLLYIADVSEDRVKSLDGSDAEKLAAEVSYLLLKREWKKVWYRYRYRQGE